MFHRLLRLPPEVRRQLKPPVLRQVLHGAAPCPVHTKRAIMDWLGPVVWEYYAATEGSGSFVTPEQWLQRPGTVGKPPTDDHVKILDDDGQQLPAGEVGTVYLKLVKGGEFHYHKAQDKTASSRIGSHYTLGDVGYLDEDGYLYLTDRSANLIISGGVNIYPAEVEAVLSQHPAVLDVGVIGVPSEEWGEEVKAVVEATAGAERDSALADELIAFCRGHLAHFKCPRSVDFVDALPRHDNGKLYKRKLRDPYWQGRERAI
jgi:long-chain acyl-CoA synthetase